MTEDWDDPPESEGITRGPEEALEREIARSKALKVERLQLRDQVATLQKEVEQLTAENRSLQDTLAQTGTAIRNPAAPDPKARTPRPMVPRSWAWSLLIFNLLALGILLIFLLGR
ncbi:hypothetical protein NITGR_1010012 [Nitrospina gracilis 3/211]|uniref:Uncharacterized protein n=1 Tax=Nitrospina gracilis (strain 3/211) TaxID=1266370 RepID=M1YFS4_NITG3|nr:MULTISPECIES: hypothetical protein [Nitrospina]MCF8722108.1 hypothetical protein [Nitrospina sp. Nb-3]CCQ89297.1 hypothetical protein NITGR_1010012 [Nitrospina gracilis 3/211]